MLYQYTTSGISSFSGGDPFNNSLAWPDEAVTQGNMSTTELELDSLLAQKILKQATAKDSVVIRQFQLAGPTRKMVLSTS